MAGNFGNMMKQAEALQRPGRGQRLQVLGTERGASHQVLHRAEGPVRRAVLDDAAQNKSVKLEVDVPDDIFVWADVNMLSSVLRNLLSNAIKFSTSGGKVALKGRKAESHKIEISVEDNGIGIPENLIQNLFTLNGKTGRAGTNGEPSNGLGLLICQDFIERHNGQIHVESVVGKGTTFRFFIESGK